MTLRVTHPSPEKWQLWNPVPGDPSYSANFYTPTAPYLRCRVTITHMRLAADAEKRERDRGYVTLPELDDAVVEFWAESDANLLVGMVLGHLARSEA